MIDRYVSRCGSAEAKVLLVEDDPVNRMVAMASLKRCGCEVAVAVNGAEAVAQFMAGAKFDMVLMDLQMPVMDGLEATRRIRRLENGSKHVPVVALSALDFPDTKRECVDAGMDGFVPKPLRLNVLMDLMTTHVRLSWTQELADQELAVV